MSIDELIVSIARSPLSPSHVRNTVLNASGDEPIFNALRFLRDCLDERGSIQKIGFTFIALVQETQNQEELDAFLILIDQKIPKDAYGYPLRLDPETAAFWLDRIHSEQSHPSSPKELYG